MRLVVSEKDIAARRIAEILAVGKPEADKVYLTPVYRFRRDGQDWVSIGLRGHIMKVDFPEGVPDPADPKHEVDTKKWALATLPALVRAPIQKVPAEKEIIRSLKNLAKKAEEVVIATDFDREGELIGADARGIVLDANPGLPIHRARFSALTKGEIERAFSELGVVSDELAQAGEARQDIDLVWGAVLTRYLTTTSNAAMKRAWGSVLSAGRVQTPTLKLIVDRERERELFVPETYWTLRGSFEKDGEGFRAFHSTERFKELKVAQAALDDVAGKDTGTVSEVRTSRREIAPPPPFNTTSLMAAASSEGLSPANTMRIAESLYINGLISYPRVDNTVYPPSLDLKAILRTLEKAPQYHETAAKLLTAPLHPTRGAKETTDHPPIHPTGNADPERLSPQDYKLYNLVARHFLATLSDAAVIESTRADIAVADQVFTAKGDVTLKAGFRAIYPYGSRKEEQLPAMSEGEAVRFLGAEMEEKQTQPSARYSQGKLIQEMEKLGLGTKATRHTIIQGLYDRKYVQNDPIEPTCQGVSVIDALKEYAERITTPEMTRELESDMDAIAEAHADREQVVDHSRQLLADVMEVLLGKTGEVGELLKEAAAEDAKLGKCPKSGHDLYVRYSPKTKAYFVGCSGYPECDTTYPLPKAMRYESQDEPCEECGTPRVKVSMFKQKPQVICLNTECVTRKEPEVVLAKCPTCGDGDIIVRRSPKTLKRFARCTNYDTCGVSYPLPQSGEIVPTDEPCGEGCALTKVVVHTRKGPWKICIDPECPTRGENGKGKGTKGRTASRSSKKSKGTSRARRSGGKS